MPIVRLNGNSIPNIMFNLTLDSLVSIMETAMTHHVQVGIPNPPFAHGGGHKVEAMVGINHAPSIIHCICIAMCVCVLRSV